MGLNRIGVLYDIGAVCELKQHQVGVGLRFYGSDLVFEKEMPGLHMMYQYNWPAYNRFHFFSGLQISYFFEKKTETNLHLIDPKVTIGGAWTLYEKLELKTDFSIGSTQTITKGLTSTETTHFTYLNYEVKLGICYRIGRAHQ